MPNHVDNDLTVKGPKTEIERFFKMVKSKESAIDVNKIIPYPKRFAELDKIASEWDAKDKARRMDLLTRPADGFNQGGYEWCVENWGTKWGLYNFSEVKFSLTRTAAIVTFQSAWAPAIPVFTKMAAMFPNLNFTVKYYEMGCGYQGVFKAKGDKVLENSTKDYNGNRGG